jgi:hypothetical protein
MLCRVLPEKESMQAAPMVTNRYCPGHSPAENRPSTGAFRAPEARKGLRRAGLMLLWGVMGAMTGCASIPTSFHPAHPISLREWTHQAFDGIVRTHVAAGEVDYPAMAREPRFAQYLDELDRVDPNGLVSRESRLAFWINAYNAFAIKGILDGGSPQTLWGQYRFFVATAYRVGGELITLYDLEQKILIPVFQEPRIHFAIVCASRSCPRLRSEAYVADRLEAQLDESARGFVNDPTKNRFDREHRVATVSMIFKWFRGDFEAQAGSLAQYLARYVSDPELARDLKTESYRIEFLDYDWSLNGVPYAGSAG